MGEFTPFFTAYLLFLTLVVGLVFGSFCNAWAWRLAHGGAISKGRSRCPKCDHVLSWKDLFPLFSYLFLKGRCRYCGVSISRRYPIAELVCGLFFLSAVLRFWGEPPLTLLRWLAVGCFLLTLSLVDLDIFEIPHRLLAGIILAFLLSVPITDGILGVKSGLMGAFAVSLPLLLFVLLADKVMGRETMGGGDIKLLAVLGLHFGAAKTLLLLIAACFFGILFVVLFKKEHALGTKKEIPFGPAIAAAAWFVMLFGTQILNWYLRLFF